MYKQSIIRIIIILKQISINQSKNHLPIPHNNSNFAQIVGPTGKYKITNFNIYRNPAVHGMSTI